MRFSPNRRFWLMSASLVASVAAVGCSSVRQAVGAERVTPDEFRVVTTAPLEVPPEYNLRPPRPGEPRPQDYVAEDEAQRALFGDGFTTAASDGEQLLVARTSQSGADANIRAVIDAETTGVIRRRRGFANRVMFWRGGDVADEGEAPVGAWPGGFRQAVAPAPQGDAHPDQVGRAEQSQKAPRGELVFHSASPDRSAGVRARRKRPSTP